MKQNKAILIFNRNDRQLSQMSSLLRAEDYDVYETSLPLEAIHLLQKNDIDVVLANHDFEGMTGQEFKDLAEKIRPGVNIFLLPTYPEKGSPDKDSKVDIREMVHFIQNHIRTENRLINEYSRFKDFFFSFTDRLLQVFEVKDRYFFNNDHIVSTLSTRIAKRMELEEKLVDAIQISALLRDLGKIGIHHQILDEKGKLGKEEFTLIKSHPVHTVQILKQINFPWNVDSIIMHHHEHYDGNGYPDGLSGRQIPLGSRIISIVDSYVAMTTDRPHRRALSREEAMQEILKKAGTQFDPEVVEVFLSVIREEKDILPVRKRIIVLDPDESVLSLIKLNLNGEEFDVIPAVTTADALQYAGENKPYVVIAELETIAVDKFFFYNALRRDVSTQKIPLIVIAPNKEFPKELAGPLVDFLLKPLNMDELSLKLKSVQGEKLFKPQSQPQNQPQLVEEELKGVAGSLEDLSLVDIIQVLNMGLKTAKVILIREKEKGVIYLKYGKIVNVSAGRLTGHEAFFELMGWEKGVFRIFHGHTTDETNVTMDTMNLLLEASKVLDEKRFKAK